MSYHKAFGWNILPLKRGTKQPTSRGWKKFQDLPSTTKQTRQRFRAKGISGLAVILGQGSGGIACRDFDVPEAYERWQSKYPTVAEVLPTAKTKRGYHVFFWLSESSDLERIIRLGDGELRLSRCLVALPPSEHPEGGRYEWLREPSHRITIDPAQVGLAEGWLEGHILTEHTEHTEQTEHTHSREKIPYEVDGAVIDKIIDSCIPTKYGERNNKIWLLTRSCLTDAMFGA